MKIGHKLTLGFIGLTVLLAALGYICLRKSQETLEQAIGKNSADLVEQIMSKIDKDIYARIEELQAYATDELAENEIILSNEQFESLSDPGSYIRQVDSSWNSPDNKQLVSLEQLTNNNLALELRARKDFYLDKYGYPLVSEMFITNKFGANIAQTNKTTDYNQADEDWWQIAKRDGLFVSVIKIEESTNTTSYEIDTRINDANGNFIGVAKAVINSQEISDTINRAKVSSEYKTTQFYLLNQDSNLLYATTPLDSSTNSADSFISCFVHPDLSRHKLYSINDKLGEKNVLFAHAHSRGYKNYTGHGRILLMQIDGSEVFAPIADLRNTLFLAGVCILGLFILASSVTYRAVIAPLAEIQEATLQIASGNLDTNLITNRKDEIGQLAGSLQIMARELKKTITDLGDEIGMRKSTQNQLLCNQTYLNSIFDSIQDGIGIMDKDLTITKVNSYLEKMHHDSMPLLGKKCYQAYHDRDSACPDCPCVYTLKTGMPLTKVFEHHCRNTEWIELSAFPLKDGDGNVTGVIEHVKDVTVHKKAENTLEILNKNLEATVDELSRTNQQMQDFVHIAAHDLKTPVRGIGTLADWVIADYGDKLDEKGREQIKLLKVRVLRIDKLIEAMLHFSKIARNKKEEKQLNLTKIAHEAAVDVKPPENIDIAVDTLPSLIFNREHILQVFQNLLSNAVTYMDKPKGIIRIGCTDQDKFLKFFVRDNGPGIEHRHFDRIFKIFQTLQNKDEPQTIGIGLAIVKKIVELYGGSVWVESQLGHGSTFFFTLPKQQEESVNESIKANSAC